MYLISILMCIILVYSIESTAYPSSFDFEEVLQQQKAHPEWGGYSLGLLRKGYSVPRQGHDAGKYGDCSVVMLYYCDRSSV